MVYNVKVENDMSHYWRLASALRSLVGTNIVSIAS